MNYSYFKKLMKRKVLASVLTLSLIFGVIGTVSARPMFGSSQSCNSSTCGSLGYQWCVTTTYVLWIGFPDSGSAQPC